jgi:hypothetical protein
MTCLSRREFIIKTTAFPAAFPFTKFGAKSDRAPKRGPRVEDFAFSSAVDVAKAIRRGVISSLELTELMFKRIDSINPRINAVAYTWKLPPPRRQHLKDYRIGYVLDDKLCPVSSSAQGRTHRAIRRLLRCHRISDPGHLEQPDCLPAGGVSRSWLLWGDAFRLLTTETDIVFPLELRPCGFFQAR